MNDKQPPGLANICTEDILIFDFSDNKCHTCVYTCFSYVHGDWYYTYFFHFYCTIQNHLEQWFPNCGLWHPREIPMGRSQMILMGRSISNDFNGENIPIPMRYLYKCSITHKENLSSAHKLTYTDKNPSEHTSEPHML